MFLGGLRVYYLELDSTQILTSTLITFFSLSVFLCCCHLFSHLGLALTFFVIFFSLTLLMWWNTHCRFLFFSQRFFSIVIHLNYCDENSNKSRNCNGLTWATSLHNTFEFRFKSANFNGFSSIDRSILLEIEIDKPSWMAKLLSIKNAFNLNNSKL